MSYTISGLIISQLEENVCVQRRWPVVTLKAGVSLIPVSRDFIFLVDGDEAEACDSIDILLPDWLEVMVGAFSRSAYVEAAFWGGRGMQAACAWDRSQLILKPTINSRAINAALRCMGLVEPAQPMFFGMTLGGSRKDPFDLVGLGRCRSVDEWLRSISSSGGNCGQD